MSDEPPVTDPNMMMLVHALQGCDKVRVNALAIAITDILEQHDAPGLETFWVLVSTIVALIRATESDTLAVFNQVQTMFSLSMGMAEHDDAEKREAKLH